LSESCRIFAHVAEISAESANPGAGGARRPFDFPGFRVDWVLPDMEKDNPFPREKRFWA
jgi:hypothetical protein